MSDRISETALTRASLRREVEDAVRDLEYGLTDDQVTQIGQEAVDALLDRLVLFLDNLG